MPHNLRERLGLTQGSQSGMGEMFVLESLLEHYSPGHNSDSVLDNPKFTFDPENPSQAVLKGDDSDFALTVPYDGPPAGVVAPMCNFPYTFDVCF